MLSNDEFSSSMMFDKKSDAEIENMFNSKSYYDEKDMEVAKLIQKHFSCIIPSSLDMLIMMGSLFIVSFIFGIEVKYPLWKIYLTLLLFGKDIYYRQLVAMPYKALEEYHFDNTFISWGILMGRALFAPNYMLLLFKLKNIRLFFLFNSFQQKK